MQVDTSLDLYENNHDEGQRVIYWNDGFLTLGWHFDVVGFSGSGYIISYFNADADLIWTKRHFGRSLQGQDIFAVDDESFYVSGVKYIDSIYSFDGFVTKFNINGDSILSFALHDTNAVFPYSSFIGANKLPYILVDSRDTLRGSFKTTEIYALDDSSGLQRVFKTGVYRDYFLNQLIEFDGNFYLSGYYFTAREPPNTYKAFILRLNSDFEIIDSIYPSKASNEYVVKLIVWKNRLIECRSVIGYDYPDPRNMPRLQFSEISGSDVIPINTIGEYHIFSVFFDIQILSDNYLIAHYTWDGWRSSFILIDENLDSVASTEPLIDTSIYKYISDFSVGRNKNFFGIGGTDDTVINGWMAWNHAIYRSNFIVEMTNTIGTPVEVENAESSNSMEIWPNPSNSVFNFKFENLNLVGFDILDISGGTVFSAKIHPESNSFVFDPTFLPSGIYIVRCAYANHSEYHRIIIER